MNIAVFFLLKYTKETITTGAGPFHGIHMDCSMESMVNMPKFHMESIGIHVD